MNTIFSLTNQAKAGGWLLLLAGLLTCTQLFAGGIKDVAPTAADAPVMLETGRAGFNNFADYSSQPEGRLYVSFGTGNETLYLGLGRRSTSSGGNSSRGYEFRIRYDNPDGADPVVHGPFTITEGNANVSNYDMAEFGMYSTNATDGGDSIYVFRPDTPGDYYIEFNDLRDSDDVDSPDSRRVYISLWDFTVVRDNAVREGRVWSRGWAYRTPAAGVDNDPEFDDCIWDKEFNGSLYSYTDDGFVSLIDFNDSGFKGLSFNFAFNSTGPGTSGDLAEDRKSIPGLNQTDNAREHRIFLSLPDIELFPDGVCGEVTTANTFRCAGTEIPYCLDVEVTRAGQVEILLDFNGNGVDDDGSQDVTLVYSFTDDELAACVPWNGLRGDGTVVTFADTVDVFVTYAQGIQHYSAFDVEFLRNGFCVETIRPTCGDDQGLTSRTLFYDDREFQEAPGTGAPLDGRAGCQCGDGCRTWNNFDFGPGDDCDDFEDSATTGYGDKSTLNTYWLASSQQQFQARVPVVNANIQGETAICDGTSTTLVADDPGLTDTEESYLWDGPGVTGVTTRTVEVSQAGTYCVTIDDGADCSSQTCITVTVAEFDANQFPAGLDVCFGESVQLPVAGNPTYTYQWTPTTGIDDPTSNQPTFNPTSTTTYTVAVTNENSDGLVCETTEQVTVTVTPDINLFVTGGGNICAPSTELTASTDVPATVTLFDGAGNSLGTGNTFTVAVSGDVNYVLIAETPAGCRDTVDFLVSGGPVDVAVPDSVLACLSDGINLAVTNLDPADDLTYAWTPTDLFAAGTATTATPTFTGAPGDYDVAVTVTNQYGCDTTQAVRLVVLDDTETLGFTSEVDCDGSTVSFTNTSTADFGFLYDFGDGTTSTDPNPTYTYDAPGTYTVTLSLIFEGQTCIAPFTRQITTVPRVVGADYTIELDGCNNGSAVLNFTDASLNATGGDLNYNWTFTGVTPTSSNDPNPSVTVDNSGTVTASLEVTTDDDCSSTLDTTFTVDLAVVSLEDEVIICPGDSTALNPGGNAGLTYNWSPSPDFGANEVNPTTAVAGTYMVTVTATGADFNCSNTDMITVVQADSINLVINGPDGPINNGTGNGNGGGGTGGGNGGGGNGGGNGSGDGDLNLGSIQTCGAPVELSVDLNVDQNVDVVYTDLDGNVLGNGNSLTVNPSGRDTVVVTATNEFGCVERDTIVIINNQVDAGLNVGSDGFNFCSAADTSLTVINSDPNDTLTYDWSANEIISGPLDQESVDITAPEEGSVDLSVTVTNQFGCDTTLTITVTAVPFLPNEYAPQIAPCFDEPTVINGGDRVEGYTYEWEPSDDLDLSDPANPIGTFTEDQDLTVTITDPETGCSSEQVIAVDVAPEISFMANPVDTSICAADNVVITGSSVNDDVEIIWYSDPELTDQVGTGSTFTIEATEDGTTYTVYGQATDPTTGCSQTTVSSVTLTPFTPNQYVEEITPCFGEQVDITGGDRVDGYTYEWEPSGDLDLSDPANPTGTFTEDQDLMVTITDPTTGCTETQTIRVDVAPEIAFTASPTDTVICEPGNIVVAGSSVNDDVEIVWYDDPERTNQVGTGNNFTIAATETGQSYTVYGEATDPNTGCSQELQSTVTVSDLTAGLPSDNVIACAGDPPSIFAGGNVQSGLEYTYDPANLVDNSDPLDPIFTGTESAVVTVNIFDPATGCATTEEVNFTYVDNGDLTGTAEPADILLGQSTTLTVSGCEDCTYEWFAPNGTLSSSTGNPVVATPDAVGDPLIYTVEVTENGCVTVIEIEVRVEDPFCDEDRVYVPNAFTPNGDGNNDEMRVRSNFIDQLTEFRWIIYDRWGQEVYSSDDPNGFWDGTAEGDDLEPDVYGYWLRVRCPAGDELIQQGNITILR